MVLFVHCNLSEQYVVPIFVSVRIYNMLQQYLLVKGPAFFASVGTRHITGRAGYCNGENTISPLTI